MLLRRIAHHLKEQNWIAVCLDLFVVVLGIFLAFQVERWYEDIRVQSQEGQHLQSLLSDFQDEIERLDWHIDRFSTAKAAAGELIRLSADDTDQISNDQFYELLADAQRMASVEPRRRAYDTLVATGAIESLADEELRGELGAYFAMVEAFRDSHGNWTSQLNLLWEPFILEYLDRSMLIRSTHPNDEYMLDPVHQVDKFRRVLGSDELRNVLAKRWHFYRDMGNWLIEMRDQAREIESRIAANLRRYEGEKT